MNRRNTGSVSYVILVLVLIAVIIYFSPLIEGDTFKEKFSSIKTGFTTLVGKLGFSKEYEFDEDENSGEELISDEINEEVKEETTSEETTPEEKTNENTNLSTPSNEVVTPTVTINADVICDTVDQMKKNKSISKGQKVYTYGYYSKNDGGAAYYKITDNKSSADNIKNFKLNNGLVAELIIDGQVNVKQLGAKGDGSSDDHNAFLVAEASGASTIYIPSGTYEFKNNFVTLNKFVNLVGEAGKVIIKHGGFSSKYGVSASGIIFDGGASYRISYVGTSSSDYEEGTVAFVVTPRGEVNVTYKNCTFKNLTIASFARDGGELPSGSKIKNDLVENCTFTNIRKVAIYHNLTLGTGVYTGNTFTNLGGNDLQKGFIGALFLGDVTNVTQKEATSITIKNSTFTNLLTKDDFDGSVHVINANFIAIKADKAVIDNNNFTNLSGYGNDREGVYTKVRNLTVSNNRLKNAGLGEGYICAKPHTGYTFAKILNNTLEGDAGTGIRTYSPGKISGNTINIKNAPSAITCTISDKVSIGSNSLTISGNKFGVGTSSTLNISGRTISDYSSGKVVRLSAITVPIVVENNTFATSTSFGYYVSSGSQTKSLTVRNNTFNLSNKTGVGVFVASSDSSTLTSNVSIEGNTFNVGAELIPARTRMFNPDGVTSSRTVTFIGNNITFAGNTSYKALMCETSSNNGDKLIVKNNKSNMPASKVTVINQFKYSEINNSDFATYK